MWARVVRLANETAAAAEADRTDSTETNDQNDQKENTSEEALYAYRRRYQERHGVL
jgi:hypothetical protein